MKTLTLLLAFISFSAFAAEINLKVKLDKSKGDVLGGAELVFKATSPDCISRGMGTWGYTVIPRSKSYWLPMKKLDAHSAEVKISTIDPENDRCGYMYSHLTIYVRGKLQKIYLISTAIHGYTTSDSAFDIANNPDALYEANCVELRCGVRANGNFISTGYHIFLYVDKNVLDSNLQIDSALKVKFEK